jgi:hypothetical protein
MRHLEKLDIPEVLEQNAALWEQEYLADQTNSTKRYRYRNPEIKSTLVRETAGKCVYCESKIGHNTPGDVEHKIPSSVEPARHYDWSNLTIACAECNRRKNDYLDAVKPFLDPYVDDVEDLLVHHGPIVGWKHGTASAEASIKILDLHSGKRSHLLLRKIEKIDEINNLCERLLTSHGSPLEPLLRLDLQRRADKDAEYSAMAASLLRNTGLV